MGKVTEFLDGKKTYIVGALMFVVAGLHAVRASVPFLSTIPDDTWQQAMDFAKNGGLAGIGLICLRLGMKKVL